MPHLQAVGHQLNGLRVVLQSIVDPTERPDRLPRSLIAMRPWGQTAPGLLAGAAARHPDRVAFHDDDGEITYRELWRQTQAIAASLQADGVGSGTGVGVLTRNHRGFVAAAVAVTATGADLVLLNTGFAGPQIADVIEHEGVDIVIHDDEFAGLVERCGARLIGESELAEMSISGSIDAEEVSGRVVILTSGTTGRPKGAGRRSNASNVGAVAALLERIPLRAGDTTMIAAPLFHAWGFSHLLLGLSRAATMVLSRRFDPERTLALTAEHDARVLVVVPIMLGRILNLPAETLDAHPTPKLRVIAASGSAISGKLVTAVLERFGPVLYNLYGSTEVSVATIANPDDLQADPTTAGRPAFGVDVEIVDVDGEPVADGEIGRVFVGGSLHFDGYTGGGDKERVRGLVSTGDMGRFVDGRLFIEGRDDDMIVSGGENVYPREVEELLAAHPAIDEAAVIGVPDEEFGQVLAAFVVLAPGGELDADGIRTHVKDHLARHKVPRTIKILDELPRNATGKILKRELAT